MPCVWETCPVCGKHGPSVRNMACVWETCPMCMNHALCVGNMPLVNHVLETCLCQKHALCAGNMFHVWETCSMGGKHVPCGKHAPYVGNMMTKVNWWLKTWLKLIDWLLIKLVSHPARKKVKKKKCHKHSANAQWISIWHKRKKKTFFPLDFCSGFFFISRGKMYTNNFCLKLFFQYAL